MYQVERSVFLPPHILYWEGGPLRLRQQGHDWSDNSMDHIILLRLTFQMRYKLLCCMGQYQRVQD